MSLSASCESVSQKRTLSTLLAGRVAKKPKQEDCGRLHEATIQLLEQQQNLRSLFREVGNRSLKNIFPQKREQKPPESEDISCAFTGSLLMCELRRQASKLGVPVAAQGVKMVLETLAEITGAETAREVESIRTGLLTSSQRAQLCVLLQSTKDLLSHGAFCPKLLWQEYRRDKSLPDLEVVYHLHCYNILPLKYVLESEKDVQLWLVTQLRTLSGWTPLEGEEETVQVQQSMLSTVVGVLVATAFEPSSESTAAPGRTPRLCCSVLDDVLSCLLDTVEENQTLQTVGAGAEKWTHMFDASLCGASVSAEALRRFFTHSLTHTLTYKPRLTVSDAIAQQDKWIFAKSSPLLTCIFRKLSVIFSVELLLAHLQQVLETHEVNWKHVLNFLSTLLVYNPQAQRSLKDLLSRLLTSAFEGYDLENMITAFLLARQGGLEGPAIFPSYSDWFKMSFSGGSSHHANSKKSLVFLLKFLSDLVPFEPPQYLKIHILHPPYVPMKHRSLLMEYVSLAKTRLADLKESVEEMGLYEDVLSARGASVECQAVQDVAKAVSLFESTGRIPATVMEASIFRKPYFLTRFLPALMAPRVLPLKADARMTFIEALKKADKIPSAQFSSYVESCQKERRRDGAKQSSSSCDDPVDMLKAQLQDFTQRLADGKEGEMSAQLSRISHTLRVIFPGGPDELIGQPVVKLHTNDPSTSELHLKTVNMLLRSFCQCLLATSRANPPNKQNMWASMFAAVLLGNTQLLCSVLHRLWDLFRYQESSLSGAHLLGLAAFAVHLHASSVSSGALVQLVPPLLPEPVTVGEALSSALVCTTRSSMIFCVRLCVAAVCYGMCRRDSAPQQQQQDFIPSSFYKKLLYIIPRLLPACRGAAGCSASAQEEKEENPSDLWTGATDSSSTWRKTALQLWRHPAFCQQGDAPQYQLSLQEWLSSELRVQRSEDALTDPERQEYQQWACLEFYLTRPQEQGGCGGDTRSLCRHLLSAIMDQELRGDHSLEMAERGTCMPDILSRLQELIYEMQVSDLPAGQRHRADVHDYLFELVSQRCSVSTSASQSVAVWCSLQRTLNSWNRILLALPAALLVRVKREGGRTSLDCSKLMEHINQHQRNTCSPAGLLPRHLTGHFLKGVLCAGVQCGHPAEEVNKTMSQISLSCPLLLVSAVHSWQHLSQVLSSLWCRLRDGEPLPEQLQLLATCRTWACSLAKGSSLPPPPSAPAVLLAACLHCACASDTHGIGAALNRLRPETNKQHRQMLVFLLSLCVRDHLSALLYPQERSQQRTLALCSGLLSVLVEAADWLSVFTPNQQSVYLVTSDDSTRLMPWVFFSLLIQQSSELQQRAVTSPGFLWTAVLCYVRLLQLFVEGQTSDLPDSQAELSEILSLAKKFLLRAISLASPTALSSSQLKQLESQCADVDPEVAAALSVHLDPPSLSPEMDFL